MFVAKLAGKRLGDCLGEHVDHITSADDQSFLQNQQEDSEKVSHNCERGGSPDRGVCR